MSNDTKSKNREYKILIVDDDENILNLLRITLERGEKFYSDITTATNGTEALEKLRKSKYDLIIADHKMPIISGIELLTEVKNKYPNTARILITGYSELEIAKEAINKASVHNYIEKPWDNDELREVVNNVLSVEEDINITDIKILDNLELGQTYLFEEKKSNKAIKFTIKKIDEGMNGLFITRIKPERLIEEYKLDKKPVDIYWLTRIHGKKILQPANLELIADKITRYFEEKGGIVLLEGLESLTRDNSFERIIGFLENIIDVTSMENGILIISIDPRTVSQKELALIERNVNIV